MTQTYDLIIRGGEVVNHAGRGIADIGIRNGKFAFVGDLSQASAGEVIDATGLTVLPGVIDSQVHFREPGLEWKEDLETGANAAVLGGVFLWHAVRVLREAQDAEGRSLVNDAAARATFRYSLYYLFALFGVLAIDKLVLGA